jgi:hypothetical protein
VESLARKARAIADLESSDDGWQNLESFGDVIKRLQQWDDIDSKKYAVLSIERAKRAGHSGLMLKLIASLLEKKGSETKDGFAPLSKDDLLKERKKVLGTLEYDHLKSRDSSWAVIASLKEFALF